MSFEFIRKLPTPTEVKNELPVPKNVAALKTQRDKEIADVITGRSDKFLAIIGPCSADNEDAVLDYTLRLKKVQEKILEDYNDVFADIINGLVFKGEQRILPESLKNAQVHSQYKAEDGKVHELERDVIKYWKEKEVELAICGIEN